MVAPTGIEPVTHGFSIRTVSVSGCIGVYQIESQQGLTASIGLDLSLLVSSGAPFVHH